MPIKKGDFIEIDYVGRLQENNKIFDLTSQKLAQQEGIYNPKASYGPRIICVGEAQVVKGLDDSFIGKNVSLYTLNLHPEDAFGKKNPQLIKIVSASMFKNQQVKPFPGLQLDMDGLIGTVRAVSGGRIVIDFNHPLAGRDVLYEITIKRIVTDIKEKISSVLAPLFGAATPAFTYQNNILTISSPVQQPLHEPISQHIKKIFPETKEVQFSDQKASTKKTTPAQ